MSAGGTGTGDIRIPSWVGFAAKLLPIALALVGYGELRAKVSALDQRAQREAESNETRMDDLTERIRRLEVAKDEDRKELHRTLLIVRDSIGEVQVQVAEICVQIRCGRRVK